VCASPRVALLRHKKQSEVWGGGGEGFEPFTRRYRGGEIYWEKLFLSEQLQIFGEREYFKDILSEYAL